MDLLVPTWSIGPGCMGKSSSTLCLHKLCLRRHVLSKKVVNTCACKDIHTSRRMILGIAFEVIANRMLLNENSMVDKNRKEHKSGRSKFGNNVEEMMFPMFAES